MKRVGQRQAIDEAAQQRNRRRNKPAGRQDDARKKEVLTHAPSLAEAERSNAATRCERFSDGNLQVAPRTILSTQPAWGARGACRAGSPNVASTARNWLFDP